MTDSAIGLGDIEAAYRRLSLATYRALEDAYDFEAEAIVAALERDQRITNAAFFVLIFGQLEQHIIRLAAAHGGFGPGRSSFRRMLAVALPDARDRRLRREIEQWYKLRNNAAHGEAIGASYNIQAILERARELERRLPGP